MDPTEQLANALHVRRRLAYRVGLTAALNDENLAVIRLYLQQQRV